jgi:hypothetical protein
MTGFRCIADSLAAGCTSAAGAVVARRQQHEGAALLLGRNIVPVGKQP